MWSSASTRWWASSRTTSSSTKFLDAKAGTLLEAQLGKQDKGHFNMLRTTFNSMATQEEINQLLPSHGERLQAEFGTRRKICARLSQLVEARYKDFYEAAGQDAQGLCKGKALLTNAVQTRSYALEKTKEKTQFSIEREATQAWRKQYEERPQEEQPSQKKQRKAPAPIG